MSARRLTHLWPRLTGSTSVLAADPDDPSLPELGHQAGPAFLLAAERGPALVLLEPPQEPGPGQSPLVAGHLGAEHLHQRRRPGLRHAEEPLAVRRVSGVRSSCSSWLMSSGMESSHRGFAGTVQFLKRGWPPGRVEAA